MKHSYFYLLLLSCLIGCSPTESENESDPDPVSGPVKLILKMEGGDDVQFHYENGLLVKALGNSTAGHVSYQAAFQIEYNSNKKVDRLLVLYADGFNKPANFNWDLNESDAEFLEIYDYNYLDNRLTSITRESGNIEEEFFYDNQGRISKHRYFDSYHDSWIQYDYTYDSDGKLVSYIYKRERTGVTRYGKFESDNKVNPFYTFWENHSLIMPGDFAAIMNENFSFYPHNITAVYQAEEKWFGVHIEYEGDYPVVYDVDALSNFNKAPTRFTYIN